MLKQEKKKNTRNMSIIAQQWQLTPNVPTDDEQSDYGFEFSVT